MNCEMQNYSSEPQCSTHRDLWINTEINMGKERGMCVLPFAFFMCVIALLGISPVPVQPRQTLHQRATLESPPHFCHPFICQWTSRPIYYIQVCTVGSNNHGGSSNLLPTHFISLECNQKWNSLFLDFVLLCSYMCVCLHIYMAQFAWRCPW